VAWLFWMSVETPAGMSNTAANYMTAAAALFIIAALTDLFDGMAARAFNAHSKFGRIIDPIADKALVGLPLIVIAMNFWQIAHPSWLLVAIATAVIVVRDTTMTVLRLVAPDGEGARVSQLAKVKTALELVVIGSLLVIGAATLQFRTGSPSGLSFVPYSQMIEMVWLVLLVAAAALSAWTAFQYLLPKRPA
jgi:CDP-diacylglycerol--glycerol-3-phosphate 3-phosphatidyltransferase